MHAPLCAPSPRAGERAESSPERTTSPPHFDASTPGAVQGGGEISPLTGGCVRCSVGGVRWTGGEGNALDGKGGGFAQCGETAAPSLRSSALEEQRSAREQETFFNFLRGLVTG